MTSTHSAPFVDHDDAWLYRAFAYADGTPADPLHDEDRALVVDGYSTTDLSGLCLTHEGREHMRADFVRTGGNPHAFDHLLQEIPLTSYEVFGEHWGRLHRAGPNWRRELDAIKAGLFRSGDGRVFKGPIRDGAPETAGDHNRRKAMSGEPDHG